MFGQLANIRTSSLVPTVSGGDPGLTSWGQDEVKIAEEVTWLRRTPPCWCPPSLCSLPFLSPAALSCAVPSQWESTSSTRPRVRSPVIRSQGTGDLGTPMASTQALGPTLTHSSGHLPTVGGVSCAQGRLERKNVAAFICLLPPLPVQAEGKCGG